MEQDKDPRLDIPQGVTSPWKFIQKRIIFEFKLKLSDAFTSYFKIYQKEKINHSKLQDCVTQLSQLWIEISSTAEQNPKVKKLAQETVNFLNDMVADPGKKWDDDDFPELYKHYLGIQRILYLMDLTNIEAKHQDPGEAIVTTGE